jgi:uncharacterized protein YjbI with pentapeptide repeats
MEYRRIDALSRVFVRMTNRRETLTAALALLLTGSISGEAAAKKGGKRGKARDQGNGGGNAEKKAVKKTNRRLRRRELEEAGTATLVGLESGALRDCTGLDLAPGADLRWCDLTARDLQDADLTNANLSDANLSGIDAEAALFRGARMWRANLDGAALMGARFDRSPERRTDLFSAIFSNADLTDATLEGAIYSHYAAFDNAILCHTTLANGTIDDSGCVST